MNHPGPKHVWLFNCLFATRGNSRCLSDHRSVLPYMDNDWTIQTLEWTHVNTDKFLDWFRAFPIIVKWLEQQWLLCVRFYCLNMSTNYNTNVSPESLSIPCSKMLESVFVNVYHNRLENWVVQATLVCTNDFQEDQAGLQLSFSDYVPTLLALHVAWVWGQRLTV